MKMKNYVLVFLLLSSCLITAQKYSNTSQDEVSKEWNGNTFSSKKSFFENIKGIQNLSFLIEALQNEDFRNKLESEEMITIFAPLDQSFLKLPKKTSDSIVNYSNGDLLKSIVKYHIVPGRIDYHSLLKSIKVNNGIAYFSTIEGEKLGIKEINGELLLFDSKNNTSIIKAYDFYHKNGLFHFVEGIVFPVSEE